MDQTSYATKGVFDHPADFDGLDWLERRRLQLRESVDDDRLLESWLHPSADAAPSDAPPPSLVDDAVDQAVRAIQALTIDGDARLGREAMDLLALGVERVRRCAEAAAVAVAGVVDEQNPFLTDGFRSGKNWIRHRNQLTAGEAFRRIQTARMHARLEQWADAAERGVVGVGQSHLMGQIAANPRIEPDVLAAYADDLLDDAITLPYEQFEAHAKRWEQLADRIGTAAKAERLRAGRHANLVHRRGGGWTLTAHFDDISGEEFNNIFNHYTAAEAEHDIAEAKQRAGDDPSVFDLRRSELQRRADALLNMAAAAAACPPDGVRPVPTLNVLIDDDTAESGFHDDGIDLARYRDVTCRTNTGHALDPYEVIKLAHWAEIRRVVLDSEGVVIDMGRKQRCFTGSARDAALLLALGCDWPGCPAKHDRLQVDHVQSWARDGTTDQRNAGCDCGWHNRLKEQGYRVHRDANGTWHFHHPDGHEIL
jgi:Domain of unknown function (DUF222)